MIEIAVLGELQVRVGGIDSTPRAPKERVLLAVLAAGRSRAVPAERLAEELWPDLPAAQARHVLQVRVAALRKRFAAAGATSLLSWVPPGYRLELDGASFDAASFEAAVANAELRRQEGDGPGAAAVLRGALDLWRGDAYADAQGCVTVELEAARLEELRLLALESRVACDLDAGEHRRLVPELGVLVAAHPFREGLWSQRVLALYRSGRQAEALRACQAVRERLRDDLGLDPGPALQHLETAVLARHPDLDWAPPARPPPAPATRPEGGPGTGPGRPVAGGLPTTDPLVGRDLDLARVAAMVRSHRLVTITGPGGVGKSRLAIAAAQEVAPHGPSASRVVELAALSDPSGLVGAIAGTLELSTLVTTVHALGQQIGSAPLLVVLDNCEHLVEEVAAAVSELLGACPQLRLLCTSQEALALAAEHVWPLQPLDAAAGASLFHERAGAVRPDLVHDPDAVAAIVEGLDGLPLAIELAAAKVATASAAEIAARLDDRFRLLAGDVRGHPHRHRALRAMVEWSHELLTADQQQLFRRLAVFAGSFTGEAARQVAGADLQGGGAPDVRLDQLVRRSLVVADVGTVTTRYRLLQTLRQFALERLEGAGEREAIAGRHARWCAEDALGYAGVHSPEEERWLAHGLAELDNLRAAVEHAVAARDVDLAVRLVARLRPLTALWRAELLEWARTVVALPGAADHPDVGSVHVIVATMASNLGAWDEAGRACDEALRRPLPEEAYTVAASRRANMLAYRGRMREAGAVMVEALGRVAHPHNRIHLLSIQVSSEAFTGRSLGIDGRELIRAADHTHEPGLRSLARTMVALGLVGRGEAREAADLVHEALAIAGSGLNRDSVNLGREVLALAAVGAQEDLAGCAARALELSREYPLGLSFAIVGLLRTAHAQGLRREAAMLAGYLFHHPDELALPVESARVMAGGPPEGFVTDATRGEFVRGRALDEAGLRSELTRLAQRGPSPAPLERPAQVSQPVSRT